MSAAGTPSLADLTDGRGRFGVLAIDHRDSLRAFLSPDDPTAVSAEDLVALKIEMVRTLAPEATGVMLEPEYSVPQVLEAGALPEGVGFTVALEAQGYLGNPEAGPTTLLEGYSIEQARESGASCAKLLLPYRPDRPLAEAQEQVGRRVVEECRRVGLPIVLEPLFYGLEDPAARPGLVLLTASRFAEIGPDLLKLPFPLDTTHDPDPERWRKACGAITDICPMPWVLLSGGGSFDAYADALEVAVVAGAAGFMVGRALWGEAAVAPPDERAEVLEAVVRPRLRRLRELLSLEADPPLVNSLL